MAEKDGAPEGGQSLAEKYSWARLSLLALVLSCLAWFPKSHYSLTPLWFISTDSGSDLFLSSVSSPGGELSLLVHSNDRYSTYTIPPSKSQCVATRPSLLHHVTPRKASPAAAAATRNIASPLAVDHFTSCRTDGKKEKCTKGILVFDEELQISAFSSDMNKLLWSVDIIDIESEEPGGEMDADDDNNLKDVGIFVDSANSRVLVVLQLNISYSGVKPRQPCLEELCIFAYRLSDGSLISNEAYPKTSFVNDWSKYGRSLEGLNHHHHSPSDSRVQLWHLQTDEQLEMVDEQEKLSLDNRVTIGQVFGGGAGAGEQDSNNLNAYLVHFSSGVVILDRNSLERTGLIRIEGSHGNRSIFTIRSDEICSLSSIDIGSGLQTIGIPRVFAEAKVLGQSGSKFQKLLSVHDLVGMSIEESLEEMSLLQPPIELNSHLSDPTSKFEYLAFVSNSKPGPTDPPRFLFHIGNGNMKCYDLEGSLVWRGESSSKWQHKLKHIKSQGLLSKFRPHISLVHSMNAVFIQGFDTISVISQSTGYQIASASLPGFPIQPPVIADFNRDGTDDFIVPTDQGVVGFSICSSYTRPQVYVFYAAMVFAVFLFVLSGVVRLSVFD